MRCKLSHPLWIRNLTATCLAAATLFTPKTLAQETPLAWEATGYFRYNIENIVYDRTAGTVKVIFSVSNPLSATKPIWDIKNDGPFKGGRSSRLGIDIGWDTSDYTNTGSNGGSLNPIAQPAARGAGAALPVTVNALTASTLCANTTVCPGVSSIQLRFWVSASISPLRFPAGQNLSNGVAGIEGHPACDPGAISVCPQPTLIAGVSTLANVPVKSVVRYFSLTGGTPVARRQVVDIDKCKVCHNNGLRNGKVIPRLSLHGGNRNEEPMLCVICHNPNQTDIPYRTAGAEVAVDFKRMVHSIHSGGFRQNPFTVIGFQGTVYDFSRVRFPAELSNCVNCHIDTNGKGTFELPIPTALGTTIVTQSVAGGPTVDVDPYNDLKISPTAATCSGCHDRAEVQSHMTRTGGASFGVTQANLTAERCVNCHGRGKQEDVRRAHEISGSTSSRRDD